MSERLYFLDMFGEYRPDETLQRFLGSLQILGAELDQPHRSMKLELFSEEYIPLSYVSDAVHAVMRIYMLTGLDFTLTHPSHQLQRISADELKWMFVAENSMFCGSLAGAVWEWNENHLTVKLRGNGKKELEKTAAKVQASLKERFGCDVTISFEAGNALEGKALFDAMERLRSEMISEAPAMAEAPKKEAPAAPVATDVIF